MIPVLWTSCLRSASPLFSPAAWQRTLPLGGCEKFSASNCSRRIVQVVKAILKAVKAEAGLATIHASDVVQFFGEVLGSQTAGTAVKQMDQPKKPEEPVVGARTLAELLDLGQDLWHSKPAQLVMPDGDCISVLSWTALACEVVKSIGLSAGLPVVPFRGLKGAETRWFLSLSPVHENGTRMISKLLLIGGREIYIDVDRSSSNFVECLCNLCDACGVSTASYRVQLAQQEEAET